MAALGTVALPVTARGAAGKAGFQFADGSHQPQGNGVARFLGVGSSSLYEHGGHALRALCNKGPRIVAQERRRLASKRDDRWAVMAVSDGPSEGYISDGPPSGCSRVKVTLGRPLGMILEEDKSGNIFVSEIVPNGNAQRSGSIDVGDQLIATSAVVYNDSDDYLGVTVMKGMQEIRLNVRGERFETIMAAISTHPAHMKVTLELQKCKPNGN